jgi:hypothetical protein
MGFRRVLGLSVVVSHVVHRNQKYCFNNSNLGLVFLKTNRLKIEIYSNKLRKMRFPIPLRSLEFESLQIIGNKLKYNYLFPFLNPLFIRLNRFSIKIY